MSDISIENLLETLSPGEKVAAMNYLWRLLAADPSVVIAPDWHGEIIGQRLLKPLPGPRLPLEAAFDEIRQRVNSSRTESQNNEFGTMQIATTK